MDCQGKHKDQSLLNSKSSVFHHHLTFFQSNAKMNEWVSVANHNIQHLKRAFHTALDCTALVIVVLNTALDPGVVPNTDPCQIIIPLVLVDLGLGVGEGLGGGVGLGLGNQVAISTRGVIIWQGVENGAHHRVRERFTRVM